MDRRLVFIPREFICVRHIKQKFCLRTQLTDQLLQGSNRRSHFRIGRKGRYNTLLLQHDIVPFFLHQLCHELLIICFVFCRHTGIIAQFGSSVRHTVRHYLFSCQACQFLQLVRYGVPYIHFVISGKTVSHKQDLYRIRIILRNTAAFRIQFRVFTDHRPVIADCVFICRRRLVSYRRSGNAQRRFRSDFFCKYLCRHKQCTKYTDHKPDCQITFYFFHTSSIHPYDLEPQYHTRIT